MNSIASLISKCAHDVSESKGIIQLISDFFDGNIMNIFTGVSAIIALIISITNFAYLYYTKKKKITVYFGKTVLSKYTIGVPDSNGNEKEMHIFKMHFRIDNRSQLPISITQIRILIDGVQYDSEPRPYMAETFCEKTGKEIQDKGVIRTEVLPIYLNSLASHSGYLAFLIPPNTLSGHETTLNFQICTTRGKAIENTLALHVEHRFG